MQAVAAVKERPILFSPAMIRAILGETKTQTRRVAKFIPREPGLNLLASSLKTGHYCTGVPASGAVLRSMGGACWNDRTYPLYCPYGVPGDRLYVKEGSWIWCKKRPDGATAKGRPKFRYVPVGRHVVYRAGGVKPTERIDADPSHQWRLKVARFMPKWASRLTLEVVSVRVERVQEISEADAIAEGLGTPPPDSSHASDWSARKAFKGIWGSINGARPGCAWADNPWVWCIEFRKVAA